MQTDTTKMKEMMSDDIRQNKQVACTSSVAPLWITNKSITNIANIRNISPWCSVREWCKLMCWWWLRWWVMACGKINIWLILHLMLICESQESPFVRPLLSLCSTIVTNIIRWMTMMATMRMIFRIFQFCFKNSKLLHMMWIVEFRLKTICSTIMTNIRWIMMDNVIIAPHQCWWWIAPWNNHQSMLFSNFDWLIWFWLGALFESGVQIEKIWFAVRLCS